MNTRASKTTNPQVEQVRKTPPQSPSPSGSLSTSPSTPLTPAERAAIALQSLEQDLASALEALAFPSDSSPSPSSTLLAEKKAKLLAARELYALLQDPPGVHSPGSGFSGLPTSVSIAHSSSTPNGSVKIPQDAIKAFPSVASERLVRRHIQELCHLLEAYACRITDLPRVLLRSVPP